METLTHASNHAASRHARERLLYEMVGRRIREVRDEHQITRRQLAVLCGLSMGNIQDAEDGKPISLLLLVSVAEVFDLNPAELIPCDAT